MHKEFYLMQNRRNWPRVRLHLVWLSIPLIIANGCRDKSPEMIRLDESELLESFETASLPSREAVESVIRQAASSRHSISYIDMRWSIQSVVNRRRFARFVAEYQSLAQSPRPHMFFIDCTSITDDYAPLSRLPGWESKIAGMGELIWMENGRVLKVDSVENAASVEELIRITDELFPNDGNQTVAAAKEQSS